MPLLTLRPNKHSWAISYQFRNNRSVIKHKLPCDQVASVVLSCGPSEHDSLSYGSSPLSVRSEVAIFCPLAKVHFNPTPFWSVTVQRKSGTKQNTTQNLQWDPSIQGLSPNSPCFYWSLRVWLSLLAGTYLASKLAESETCNQASLPSKEAELCCSSGSDLKRAQSPPCLIFAAAECGRTNFVHRLSLTLSLSVWGLSAPLHPIQILLIEFGMDMV